MSISCSFLIHGPPQVELTETDLVNQHLIEKKVISLTSTSSGGGCGDGVCVHVCVCDRERERENVHKL